MSALRMLWAMERMERSRPPGVLSFTTRAWSRSAWARSMAAVRSLAVTGVMAPSSSITATGAGAAWAAAAWAKNIRLAAATIILRMSLSPCDRNLARLGSERAAKTHDRLGQALDLGGRVVDGEARTQRAGDAEVLHEGLSAVMARPHGDPALVEEGGSIVRMDAVHVEGDHRALDLGVARPIDRETVDASERVEAPRRQVALVGGHALHTQLAQIFHGGAQPHGAGDGRCAGLEAPRQVVPLGMIDPHFLDHLAPAPRRLEGFQDLPSSVENADAGGPEHLVAGEDVEVRAHRGEVEGQVRRALGAVQEHEGPNLVRAPDDLGHGIDRPQDIGNVGGRHHPSARREETGEGFHVEEALAYHRHGLEDGAVVAAGHLPGNEVGVMLHLGDDDLVAGPERPPHALGNQVDRLRGAAREDDLLAVPRPHEAAHGIAGALVELGRLLTKGVDGAVDVGVAPLVIGRDRFDHRPRLLAGGRGVEIDQRRAVHHTGEDGEIRAATFAHLAHLAASFPSRADCSTVRGSDTHLSREGRTSDSKLSNRSAVVRREASSTGSPIARSSNTSAEATQMAQLSPWCLASARRPSFTWHSMRMRSPQRGFTSSKVASGRSRLPR